MEDQSDGFLKQWEEAVYPQDYHFVSVTTDTEETAAQSYLSDPDSSS